MPLIKSKSPKAFEKNLKAEMKAGKPQDQALAIAYSVKKKAKKMADGGEVNEDKGQHKRTYQQKGIHKPFAGRGNSMLGASTRGHFIGEDPQVARDTVQKVREENEMIKPKLKGLAEGGQISAASEKRPSIGLGKAFPLKHPSMVPSDVLDARLRAVEDHLQAMAEGGMINEAVPMHSAEEDMEEHPADMMSDDSEMAPAEDEVMSGHQEMLAEGGMAEEDMDDSASIAASIMSKRKRMAEGGMVDLAQNAEEEPNNEDQMSFDALKKENYSESEGLDALDEPMDSNESGDPREANEENEHDDSVVGQIRRKMRVKSPISR